MDFFIGIDLGGTKISGILLDSENNVIKEDKKDTQTKNQASVIDGIKTMIDELLSKTGVSLNQLKGIGIGVAGHVDYKEGQVIYCPNLPIENVNLRDLLQKEYGVPIFIENDANAAAIGEKYFGAARDSENFVCVTLGTGIGGGIFVNGEIYRGATGGAGEIGHMILDFSPDAPLCGCGKRGCFEALTAGNAIARKAKELSVRYPNFLAEKEITAKMVIEMAQRGNELAIGILNDVANIIGVGFANIVNLFNPEKIIVTGSLAEAEDLILKPAVETMKQRAFSTNARFVKVVKSEIDNKAGTYGAAALAISKHS